MAIPFISRTDLENYLEYEVNPDKAAIALDSACSQIRSISDQKLEYVENDVVALNGSGSDTLLLPEIPVYSVGSVVYHPGRGAADVTLVEGTDWVLDKVDGSISTAYLGSPQYTWYQTFFRGRQNYTVTYTHGYVSDASVSGLPPDVQEWPSDLRLVALQLATRIYEQGIVASESVGSVSASYAVVEGILVSAGERDILERVVGIGRRR